MTTQSEPRVGVGAAIIENESILLIRRVKEPEGGHWALPGGKVDLWESCEAAAIRETREELGIVVKSPILLAIMDLWDDARIYHWVSPIYLFTEYDGLPSVQEPEKHTECGWFSMNALPSPCTKAVKIAVQALKTS